MMDGGVYSGGIHQLIDSGFHMHLREDSFSRFDEMFRNFVNRK